MYQYNDILFIQVWVIWWLGDVFMMWKVYHGRAHLIKDIYLGVIYVVAMWWIYVLKGISGKGTPYQGKFKSCLE